MTEQQAMRMALEALEQYHSYMEPLTTVFGGPRVPAEQSTTGKVEQAITSLRQAIAEAEKQEPVAWQVMVEDETMKEFPIKDMAHDWCVKQNLSGSPYKYWLRPLYTRPQPKAEQEQKREHLPPASCEQCSYLEIHDAVVKDSDRAFDLLRRAETEMRYAGWTKYESDNSARNGVYEQVKQFLEKP